MSGYGEGLWPFLILIGIAACAHEPWRWLGVVLGRTITTDSEVFQWVRAVSTALIAALVMRLVLFPTGELANVPVIARVAAVAVGVATFFVSRRSIAAAVGSGAATLAGLILTVRTIG